MTINQNRLIVVLVTLIFVTISCGKKIEDTDTTNTPRVSVEENEELVRLTKSERTHCASRRCPRSLAKLVILDGNQKSYCPAVLVDSQTLALSSRCLPRRMRTEGFNCYKSIIASFVRGKRQKALNYRCGKVVYTSSQIFELPELWSEDLALIKLKQRAAVRPMRLSYTGMEHTDTLTKWSLSNNTDFSRAECSRILNSYANPFASSANSSLQLIQSCSREDLRFGGILLNRNSFLAGIESVPVNESLIRSLQAQEILQGEYKKMFHVSNIACGKAEIFKRLRRSEECGEIKSYHELDRRRTRLLTDTSIHQENMKEIISRISFSKKYFRWNFNFVAHRRTYSFENFMAAPKCFFGIKKWIKEFRRRNSIRTTGYINITRKNYRLETKLDEKLTPFSFINELDDKAYRIKINPYSAYVKDYTNVEVQSLVNNRIRTVTFSDIKPCD